MRLKVEVKHFTSLDGEYVFGGPVLIFVAVAEVGFIHCPGLSVFGDVGND